MQLTDAINLINDKNLYQQSDASWADLGCGSGLFSYALANLIQPGSTIYAIDKSKTSLTPHQNPNNILIKQKQLNFISDGLGLPDLDGILMANSLHFAKNKAALIHKFSGNLEQNGSFLIVEYDTDNANPWVPYPVSYNSLKKLFETAGFEHVEKINERPSAFGKSMIYAANISRRLTK